MSPHLFELLSSSPWFPAWFAAIIGAVVGSFLNVVIARVPKGQSIITPRSHCACGKSIAFYDNIPIISWLLLRGRARCCGRSISLRYPLVEIATAIAFYLCFAHWPLLRAIEHSTVIALLIGAAAIDWDTLEIPNRFSMGIAGIALVAAAAFPFLNQVYGPWSAPGAILSVSRSGEPLLIATACVFWLGEIFEAITKRMSFGLGDVKLIGAIAAVHGIKTAFFSLIAGAGIGLAYSLSVMAWKAVAPSKPCPFAQPLRSDQTTAEFEGATPIAFGPFIATAAIIALVWGQSVMWF